MSEHQCLTCKFAEWKRTATGRLHPDGTGKCTWQMPDIFFPRAAWFWSCDVDQTTGQVKPLGYVPIDRNPKNTKYTNCPTYEAAP